MLRQVAALLAALAVHRLMFAVGPVPAPSADWTASAVSASLMHPGGTASQSPSPAVVGYTAPGFESLRTLMLAPYLRRDDLGSQFSAYVGGRLVADLAGGFETTARDTPYTPTTLQQVFSSSKFATSSVFLHLANTNRIDLSAPVAKYWPEFAQGNKSHVTVKMLLGHRAGVSFLDPQRVPTLEELTDLDAVAAKIAAQPHNFRGRNVTAYHAVTRGWYLNEVARRATGKSIREIMYSEILPMLNSHNELLQVPEDMARNMPYEFHFGIPDSPSSLRDSVRRRIVPMESCSFLYKIGQILTPPWFMNLLGFDVVPDFLVTAYLAKGTTMNKALFGSGPAFTGTKEFPWSYNDPVSQRAESPSYNGFTNARTLANLAERMRRSSKNAANAKDPAAFASAEVFSLLNAAAPSSFDYVTHRNFSFNSIGLGFFPNGFGSNS
ncbi:hypothetical protein HDU82_000001, partial [Entophlyctis luteolus]